MFPWAEGGNLLQFIQKHDGTTAKRDPQFVFDVFSQLIGLAGAIMAMHKRRYRHGDLKPQNILIFTGQTSVGTWKVADLGLAKFHNETTGQRQGPTSMIGLGTVSYEPPETVTTSNSPRSRLYDMWSIGCVVLQLVICLLYGNKAYEDLVAKTQNPASKNHSSTWQAKWDGRQWKDTELHKEVVKVTDKLEKEFGSNKSSSAGAVALAELAGLAKTRLLVVQLPPERGKPSRSAYRARADEFYSELQQIQKRLKGRLGSQANLQVTPSHQDSTQLPNVESRTNAHERPSRRLSSSQNVRSHVSHPL